MRLAKILNGIFNTSCFTSSSKNPHKIQFLNFWDFFSTAQIFCYSMVKFSYFSFLHFFLMSFFHHSVLVLILRSKTVEHFTCLYLMLTFFLVLRLVRLHVFIILTNACNTVTSSCVFQHIV